MFGDYIDENNITYHFLEVKENFYRGWTYYLPVLNNKAKRVKNKTIYINKYNWEIVNNNLKINVIDFEIAK